jgi:hypothetical protein
VRLFIAALMLAGMAMTRSAQAQETSHEIEAKWTTRLGYYAGQNFANGATTGRLEGFAFGLDAPLIARVKNVGALSFTFDIAFGGTTRAGGDTDGNLYRFLLTLRRELGRSNAYAGIGLGYGMTDARGSQFSNSSGFASYFALGYLIPVQAEKKYQPLVEIGYHLGPDDKLSGWIFQAGVRFR